VAGLGIMRRKPSAIIRRCHLTTEERPGRATRARVPCGAAEGRLYLRAKPSDEWARHLWERPIVHVAPCGWSGRPLAAPVPARGRVLSAAESERARRALRRGLWPLRDGDDLYVELVPVA
jgi:hypothetical protein